MQDGVYELKGGKKRGANEESHGAADVAEQRVKSVGLAMMNDLLSFVREEEFQESHVFLYEVRVRDARLSKAVHVPLYLR